MSPLSPRSLRNLQGVHPDMVRVAHRAAELSEIEFMIIEGVRTTMRQSELVAKGASRTMRSKHLVQTDGFGHAFDVAAMIGGEPRWDWPLYDKLGAAIKQAAAELGVGIAWGGDWKTFRDGPHFELVS